MWDEERKTQVLFDMLDREDACRGAVALMNCEALLKKKRQKRMSESFLKRMEDKTSERMKNEDKVQKRNCKDGVTKKVMP